MNSEENAPESSISIGDINVNTNNVDTFTPGELREEEVILIENNEDFLEKIEHINETIKSTSIDGIVEVEWNKMSEYIQYKFKTILNEMYHSYATNGNLFNVNTDEEYRIKLNENRIIKDQILHSLSGFRRIPFTIQRICELLNDPLRFYKNPGKFLFAFNKLVDIDNY